jgi:hypothetical protein
MKVRATRLTNAMGDEVSESSWLTVGREYVALAIYTNLAATRPSVSIVVITDEGGRDFAFFDLGNFEVTDPRPSGLWRVAFDGRDLSIEPEPWADVPSFWEVLNGDIPVVQVLGDHAPQMNATRRFDSVVRELHAEAGVPLADNRVAGTGPE